MISLKLARWLLGYVRFAVRGGSPERFYTLCARSGAYLWDISSGRECCACTAARRYRFLRRNARRAGCLLRVTERHGLPFRLVKTRNHRGLWAGGAAFLLIVYLLSLRVWCVQISGNTAVPSSQLESELISAGLTNGILKSAVDPKTLAERVMLKFPSVRWMSVNLRGSAAEVVVQEKTEKPPIADMKSICNVKSCGTGQITAMKVYAGTPMVRIGDAVVDGQLLVSAVVVDQTGGSTLTHASAVITAETKRNLTVTVSRDTHKEIPTGNVVFRRNLNVFGIRLPASFQGKPLGNWRTVREQFDVSLFGTRLPLGMYEERWEEVRTESSVLTPEQTRAAAKQEAEKKEKELLKDGRVTASKVTEHWAKNSFTETLELTCEENIAKESEIFIK